jgi:hypothetical protein
MNRWFSWWAAHLPKHGPRALLAAGFLATALLFSTVSFAPLAHAATTAQQPAAPRLIFTESHGTLSFPCEPGVVDNRAPPVSANNQCDWQMELFSGLNETGTRLCLNPRSKTGTFHK